MDWQQKTSGFRYHELVFQIILHSIVLVFDAYDRKHPEIELFETYFFANHAMGALIINYVLLPRYFYRNKYLPFFIFSFLTIAGVVIIEEGILEAIYFPDTKGKQFITSLYGRGAIHNLLDVLPPIFILSGFKFAWDALRKQGEVNSLKSVIRESELQFLQSQINPHFLFNNLNNLYAHAIKKAPETPRIILELSAVLRYMLYECKAQRVALTKEVEQLNNFIGLGRLQIKNRGIVTIDVQNPLTDYQIAPLILIIFVENAFKHSASSQSDQIEIEINLKVNDQGVMTFTCQNSYEAETNTESLSSGIGLENVKTRLKMLYPGTHELKITQTAVRYHVQLIMDLTQPLLS